LHVTADDEQRVNAPIRRAVRFALEARFEHGTTVPDERGQHIDAAAILNRLENAQLDIGGRMRGTANSRRDVTVGAVEGIESRAEAIDEFPSLPEPVDPAEE
jgi:hypothetical protein